MKYLVVCSGDAGEEKTLCPGEKDAVELVESKLREGSAEADLEVYAAEPISFNVARVPVVTLSEETAEATSVQAFSGYTNDEKSAAVNPFSTEQVFSLDS
ncbi:MAG: hypothetical protein Q8L35_05835 [Actinomycetota bacterium]|nr:hypothetical protein [Actinomycetota bacterium]